jgi:hypothetical protein
MSKKHPNPKSDVGKEDKITPLNTPVMQEKKPTNFKTVGTVRKSKSGNAISLKLFAENRFFHISIRDIELILTDKENLIVGNVREYERLENLGVVKDGN